MGSVIEKTVQVLKLVASQEHCTLKTLCAAMGSKKSALCQMLRSMTETGLLLKDCKGEYHTGPLFSDLSEKRENTLNLQKRIESVAVDLNTASGANVTVATIRNGKYKRLFSCCTFKVTRLMPTAPDEENFYGNATGRILLANAPSEVKLKIIDRLGLPAPGEWKKYAKRTMLIFFATTSEVIISPQAFPVKRPAPCRWPSVSGSPEQKAKKKSFICSCFHRQSNVLTEELSLFKKKENQDE